MTLLKLAWNCGVEPLLGYDVLISTCWTDARKFKEVGHSIFWLRTTWPQTKKASWRRLLQNLLDYFGCHHSHLGKCDSYKPRSIAEWGCRVAFAARHLSSLRCQLALHPISESILVDLQPSRQERRLWLKQEKLPLKYCQFSWSNSPWRDSN